MCIRDRSCKFLPTSGEFITGLIPIFFRFFLSPIPEVWSSCGEFIVPALTIISLLHFIFIVLPFFNTSTPIAFLFLTITFVTKVFVNNVKFDLFKIGFKKQISVSDLIHLFVPIW